jgi:hypothetical protein
MSTEMNDDDEKSKRTNLILLVVGILILVGGAGLWFADINILGFFGLGGGASQKEVGKLENQTGKTRREQANEAAFQEISKNAALFNQDTVITAEDAQATLLLNDGSRLEMAPGTMVKLNFDSSLGLDGVSRTLNVQVLTGEVRPSIRVLKQKLFCLVRERKLNSLKPSRFFKCPSQSLRRLQVQHRVRALHPLRARVQVRARLQVPPRVQLPNLHQALNQNRLCARE